MTTDKLAAGGDVDEQPICALHRIFFTKRGEDCALCGTARRAGEGSQAAPNLNAEMLASDAISMILERHNTTFKDDVALNDVRAILTHFIERGAAGSGTFAAEHELLARWRKAVEGMTTFQTGWQKPYKPNDALAVEQCADELEAVLLAQEKREPAPAPTSETVTITMPLCEAADFIELIKKKGYEIAPAPATRKQ